MKIIGCYKTDGELHRWKEPLEVFRKGDTLVNKNSYVLYVKDGDDWIDPNFIPHGVRLKVLVEE